MPCLPRSPIAALWVACPFRQPVLRRAIEALKYDGVMELAEPLAGILERYVLHLQNSEVSEFTNSRVRNLGDSESPRDSGVALPEFDGVIPVPLHRRKYLFRGFNQAELFAAALQRQFGWPLLKDAVIRRRAGQAQVGRGRKLRLRNVAHAFVVRTALTGRRLLLVDDVVTTGSTLNACAQALRDAGAQSVTALALAHG